MAQTPVRPPAIGPISAKYQDFNIIPPWFAHRMRWNMRETLRQTYTGQYRHLLDELDFLEYLYRQLGR